MFLICLVMICRCSFTRSERLIIIFCHIVNCHLWENIRTEGGIFIPSVLAIYHDTFVVQFLYQLIPFHKWSPHNISAFNSLATYPSKTSLTLPLTAVNLTWPTISSGVRTATLPNISQAIVWTLLIGTLAMDICSEGVTHLIFWKDTTE